MQKLINDHYRWLGPASEDPTPAWLVRKALEVGHSNTKCSIKTLMASMSKSATEAVHLAQKQLGYESLVIGRGLKPKTAGGTVPKSVDPKA